MPYAAHSLDRIHQGDIVKDLATIVEGPLAKGETEPTADLATREYAVVLTQECDLEQDFKVRRHEAGESTHDKSLIEILLAVARPANRRTKGTSLSSVLLAAAVDAMKARHTELAPKKPWFNRDAWNLVAQNKNERYHILEPDPARHPGLLVDFKQVFSVSTEYLYSVLEVTPKSFVSSMSVPYREHLSTRYAHFASRIALPRDHDDPAKGSPAPAQLSGGSRRG